MHKRHEVLPSIIGMIRFHCRVPTNYTCSHYSLMGRGCINQKNIRPTKTNGWKQKNLGLSMDNAEVRAICYQWLQMFQRPFYTFWRGVTCWKRVGNSSFGHLRNLKKRYPTSFAPWKAAHPQKLGVSFPATKVLNASFPRSWLGRMRCLCWSVCSKEQQGCAAVSESNRASWNATHFGGNIKLDATEW